MGRALSPSAAPSSVAGQGRERNATGELEFEIPGCDPTGVGNSYPETLGPGHREFVSDLRQPPRHLRFHPESFVQPSLSGTIVAAAAPIYPNAPASMQATTRGSKQDLVDVYLLRLADREGDRSRERIGRYRERLIKLVNVLGDVRLGDAVRHFPRYRAR